MRTWTLLALAVAWIGIARPAAAQYDDPVPQATDDEVPGGNAAPAEGADNMAAPPDSMAPAPEGGATDLSDTQANTEDRYGVEQARDTTDPFEDPHEGYYFLGAFYRHTFVPKFILDLFLDDTSASDNFSTGLEFTYRKDNFDIIAMLGFARWYDDGPFRANGDPRLDQEWIEARMWSVDAAVTFLWSTPFNDIFALEYGVGIGVRIVINDLTRTEAYESSPGAGDWRPCDAAHPGSPPNAYCAIETPTHNIGESCNGDGSHFGCTEYKWSDGGDVPNIVPWLALPHLALRIKPIHQLMMRVEGGFGGYNFYVGGSLAYGF